MARIRTVKPTHWNDKELSNITLPAHLFWIATWNFSDDDGVFENDPLLLKSQIFPRRQDIRVDQVNSWLDQLVKARFIVPFSYNGNSYYISRTFKTHQRIDKPQPSLIPQKVLFDIIQEHSKNDPITVLPVEESSSKVKDSKVVYRAFAHLRIFEIEFEKLVDLGFEKNQIDSILDSIQNYKDNKKYTSLFLTAKNWLERDRKKEKSSGEKERPKTKIETEIEVNAEMKRRNEIKYGAANKA